MSLRQHHGYYYVLQLIVHVVVEFLQVLSVLGAADPSAHQYAGLPHLLVLVAHGTNDAVIVEPGLGELTTPIQPDLVRHQLGELKTVTPAERQVRTEHIRQYGVRPPTVWCDGAHRMA